MFKTFQMELAGRPLIIETGKWLNRQVVQF